MEQAHARTVDTECTGHVYPYQVLSLKNPATLLQQHAGLAPTSRLRESPGIAPQNFRLNISENLCTAFLMHSFFEESVLYLLGTLRCTRNILVRHKPDRSWIM